MKRNPDVVIVDSAVIAKSPARLLVAGMGDALATFFEARACQRSNGDNSARAKTTLAATALAQLCYETLLADGQRAKMAVEKQVCTTAVENIIEANTYLSGIGFESGGLAAAHPIHDGLSALPETHAMYHGEKGGVWYLGTACFGKRARRGNRGGRPFLPKRRPSHHAV